MEKKLTAPVYTQAGKEATTITLSEKVFGVQWNNDLVHEVMVAMQGNARANTAHTKDRSEVRGGGKKPWKQKGTGRARHGSTRPPIWTGGGVAHGPRNDRNYTRKINKNVRAKALASLLSKKLEDARVFFVEDIAFSAPKTKEAIAALVALGRATKNPGMVTKKANATVVVLPGRDENVELSFRNMQNVHVALAKDVNLVELLKYKYVVVAKPDATLKIFEHRVSTKATRGAQVAKATTAK